MIENFRLTTSAQIAYDQEAGELNLDSDEEDALYRAVQEGLTNAVRHGRADRISVRVTRTGDLVTVSIRDNGIGCAKLEEGFGLRHMRERLNMLGGTLSYGNLDSGSLSEGTIRNSISNILFKLGLRDRTQLAIWAVQTGAVNRPL